MIYPKITTICSTYTLYASLASKQTFDKHARARHLIVSAVSATLLQIHAKMSSISSMPSVPTCAWRVRHDERKCRRKERWVAASPSSSHCGGRRGGASPTPSALRCWDSLMQPTVTAGSRRRGGSRIWTTASGMACSAMPPTHTSREFIDVLPCFCVAAIMNHVKMGCYELECDSLSRKLGAKRVVRFVIRVVCAVAWTTRAMG